MSHRLNPFASETPGETLVLLSLVVVAVVAALSDVIKAIDAAETPSAVSQAATRLDRLDDDCVELWQRLVEYRGRSIYPGDCRFVETPTE